MKSGVFKKGLNGGEKGRYSTLAGLPTIILISPDFIHNSPDFIRGYSYSIPSGFFKG